MLRLPTTSSNRNILVGGWVDTWHSYSPASLGWTYFIWRVQSSLWWKWIAWNRSSLAYVVSPTVSNSCTFFRLIHDTCESQKKNFLLKIGQYSDKKKKIRKKPLFLTTNFAFICALQFLNYSQAKYLSSLLKN